MKHICSLKLSAIVALLSVAAPAATQDGSSSTSASPTSATVPRTRRVPRAVVTRLIENAMSDPENPAAWRSIAGALPRMEDGDLGGLVQAASVADSLGALPNAATAAQRAAILSSQLRGANRPGSGGLSSLAAWLRGRLESREAKVWFFGGLLMTLSGLAILARVAVLHFRDELGESEFVGLRTSGKRRLTMALSLASNGLPMNEIALRTGLAQDVLTLMLKVAPVSGAAAPPAPVPPMQSVPEAGQSPAWQATRSSFRDGRLTYGRSAG